ncbi:hypothetical protein J8273_7260 [Carpediemonas membranifera]|uniref:Uncharacterized protein n=1 Tax=Carpediemonas membranifera TaxID=201153 RepID=A0A8J6DZW5_9EUKA|nr:hypothetical protein J8273_7260 [Carpediemonas membranifera]|eukprot:KAG9390986.1 hypothetical protein J8273_7260 [Carpediemonas membranifera]
MDAAEPDGASSSMIAANTTILTHGMPDSSNHSVLVTSENEIPPLDEDSDEKPSLLLVDTDNENDESNNMPSGEGSLKYPQSLVEPAPAEDPALEDMNEAPRSPSLSLPLLDSDSDTALSYSPTLETSPLVEAGDNGGHVMPNLLHGLVAPEQKSEPFSLQRMPAHQRQYLNILRFPPFSIEDEASYLRGGLLGRRYPWVPNYIAVRNGSRNTFTVSGASMGRSAAVDLARAMCTLTTMQSLVLRDVTFKNEASIVISKALCQLVSRVEELIIDRTRMGTAETCILLQQVSKLPSLRRLAIHDVGGGLAIADDLMALESLPELTHLSLENVDLSSDHITPRLAALVQFLPKLEVLRLVNANMTASQMADVLRVVSGSGIRNLDIRYNMLHGFGREHTDAATALAQFSAVEVLNVEYCRLPELFAAALAQQLAEGGSAMTKVIAGKGNASSFHGQWRKHRVKGTALD